MQTSCELAAPGRAITAAKVKVHLETAVAIADAIRDLGRVPAGHLYAAIMGTLSPAAFEDIVRLLAGSGLVERTATHELIWTGPEKEAG